MTTFSIPNTFTPSTVLSSSQMNANFTAVVTAFGLSVGTDGATPMTGPLQLANGSAIAPAVTFASDTNTGLYRAAADQLGFAVNGASIGTWDATSLILLGSLNLGNASDTTISRVSAGVASIEGSNILMASGIGTLVQAFDAELSALAAAGSAADRLPYYTGVATVGLATFTAFARTLIDDPDATTVLATLGVSIATQADMETASSTTAVVTAGRTIFHPTHPKAFTKFDQSAGLTNNVSFGVSSLTNNATGNVTINFSTAFSTANYSPCGMAQRAASAGVHVEIKSGVAPTTTALNVLVTVPGTGDQNSAYVGVNVLGDQ